jgi:hypothetical protein
MDDRTYEIRIKEGHARLMPDDIEQTMQNLWLIYYFLIILYLQ